MGVHLGGEIPGEIELGIVDAGELAEQFPAGEYRGVVLHHPRRTAVPGGGHAGSPEAGLAGIQQFQRPRPGEPRQEVQPLAYRKRRQIGR